MNVAKIKFTTEEYLGRLLDHFTLYLDTTDLSQKYILKAADGLDAGEIFRQFYGTVSLDKPRYNANERYYDMKMAPRHVTFKIKLNPNYAESETASILRDSLYKMIAFHRGGEIAMTFLDPENETLGKLYGYVTNFEADIFTQEPTVTITLMCTYPLIRNGPITVPGLDPSFFSINDDPSNAPHGFNMRLKLNASATTIVFKGISDEDVANFGISFSFLTNDRLYIKSDPMDRQVYFVRSGITYNIMDHVYPHSIWPTMFPEQNDFAIEGASLTMEDFNYYETYWGI